MKQEGKETLVSRWIHSIPDHDISGVELRIPCSKPHNAITA